ncbi:MAG: helix-turn-helix domain-containing protein [Verrucomicrobia bacterium]|nr:helix-turn-helix domain-containing protein [Verrucomicrobiota bacterium]
MNPRLLIVEDEPATRPVDKHLASLRAKLEPDPAQPRRLKAVRGAGSRLERSTRKSSCPNPQSL